MLKLEDRNSGKNNLFKFEVELTVFAFSNFSGSMEGFQSILWKSENVKREMKSREKRRCRSDEDGQKVKEVRI